jgi:hypothetical protein
MLHVRFADLKPPLNLPLREEVEAALCELSSALQDSNFTLQRLQLGGYAHACANSDAVQAIQATLETNGGSSGSGGGGSGGASGRGSCTPTPTAAAVSARVIALAQLAAHLAYIHVCLV